MFKLANICNIFVKVDISKIFIGQLSTFKLYGSSKYSKGDLFLFLLFPALISGFLLIACSMSLTDGLILVLVTSSSIFTALLFNLLLLIYDIITKSNKNNSQEKFTSNFQEDSTSAEHEEQGDTRKLSLTERLLKETYINISYCITISLISIILLVIIYFFSEAESASIDGKYIPSFVLDSLTYVVPFFSFIVYYLLSQFMLTLLMIIKRINILLSKEFE